MIITSDFLDIATYIALCYQFLIIYSVQNYYCILVYPLAQTIIFRGLERLYTYYHAGRDTLNFGNRKTNLIFPLVTFKSGA